MDEAWKMFELSGKVTDYLSYCRQDGSNKEILSAISSTDGATGVIRESKDRETGWDRQSF